MTVAAFSRALSSLHILCLGDVMLDHFHTGEVRRISPEAPVPVLKLIDTLSMPGGAANTACNIVSLGAGVTLVAPIGSDSAGLELRTRLETDWSMRFFGAEDPRGTIVKARYSALGQQLLRIDHENLSPLAPESREQLSALALGQVQDANLIVLSDYAKGALSPELCQAVIGAARARCIPVVADPKGHDFSKYRGATVITPNELELSIALGRTPTDETELIRLASELARGHDLSYVAVTRGKNGVMLVGPAGLIEHIPSFALEVFDVSGAGDTFVAGLSCALAAGEDMAAAVHYGNAAAGVAVGKVGTAVVTPEEIEQLVHERGRREKSVVISDYAEVARYVKAWRRTGAKVGFTNGVFDLLHMGHLRSIKAARAHCDKLVVAINSDASVKRLKGEMRPVQSEEVRAAVLANMQQVDLVVIFGEDTPIEVIRACEPDLLVKGGDYRAEEVVGHEIVEARGGRVLIVPTLHGHSTTATIGRMQLGDG